MTESNPQDPELTKEAVAEAAGEVARGDLSVENGEQIAAASDADAKKKKAKKAKAKQALAPSAAASSPPNSGSLGADLTPDMVQRVMDMNPSLRAEFAGVEPGTALKRLQEMDVTELMAGMSMNGKNVKDMDAYKFWSTQPVPRFDEKPKESKPDGVIQEIKIEEVSQEPRQLMEGFEWVVMDLDDEKELNEVHELLSFHYVEDDEAMFRLNYASSFLNWALKSPGWKKEWHVGVRASKSRKLVAFISAVPCRLFVRGKPLNSAEVNFLVVHKKLRGKRLAPVMIEEITRQCYLKGVFQACYTAGTIIPKPISSCRYYHRSLNWQKLYECRFAGLPHGSTIARQVAKNRLPEKPHLKGLREMTKADVPAVTDLLDRYLKRFNMAPEFSEAEVAHWMVHDSASKEQVIWSYVVENPESKITDFLSFYLLESTVIGNPRHNSIRAAYLFYYATETAFDEDKDALRGRLNALTQDALILARNAKFDVMNGLTLLDNPMFLDNQKFQPGDGQLHYYLFNYRTAPIPGGVNEKNLPDESRMGGVGLVML